MAKIRVLLLVPNIISFQSFLSELSAALVEKGIEVHGACSIDTIWGGRQSQKREGVNLHPLVFPRGMNPIAHARAALRLNKLVSEIRPNLVHAHFSSTIFATALARRESWPVTIGTFQGVSSLVRHGNAMRVLRIAETWAARRLDAVWVLTGDDVTGLRAAASRAKVHRQTGWGFGCDLNRYDPAKISIAEKFALRSQLGLAEQTVVFAFIGRYVYFKGFDLTVRAFLKLAQEHPNARLLLIGAGDPLHSTGLTGDEEKMLLSSGQIIDAGWQAEVQKYLAITDVVVFPSQREGMPVSLMEALAMGVPVITANSRGCRDVVRDQKDGIVLKRLTEEDLVSAMNLLRRDEPLRHQLSSGALEGRERFNRLHYIENQIRVYEELIGLRIIREEGTPSL